MYSLQGRQILHRRELRKNTILNLTHITPGIYLLMSNRENGRKKVHRIKIR
ncbi:MAG: hypothetical protein ACQEQV_09620 [Fibrobacterota bacterium]